MNYTKSQQSVIDIRGKNILVSAAAGSGKTAVLVERIIKMVSDTENPVDIDHLLVLTFTNLAAGEMRERIGRAISKKLEDDPENAHLQRQMTLLHNAQITTIDSFCLFILRNHFHAIGLDPGFRVADEGELKLLKKEVIADLLEDWYESKNPDFLSCVEYFTTGSNDRDLEEYIEKLFTMSMSLPWPEEWLLERKKDYLADAADVEQYPWMAYLLGYVKNIMGGCVSELENALKICAEPDGPYMYSELLENELRVLFNLLPDTPATYSDYLTRWETIHFARLPVKKDDTVSFIKREQVKKIRSLVKDTVKETGEKFFRHSPEKLAEIMTRIQPAIATLIDVVLDYKRRLDSAKKDKNIIDFGDMEHFALHILWEKTAEGLKPSAVAKEMKKHFVTVMTDEYQDSNQVQELLLESISGEDEGRFNRFMVGDVKQSIYKFRLARPEIFMEKYDCYPLFMEEIAGARMHNEADDVESVVVNNESPNLRIDLNQNFRSRPAILNSVNYLFERLMQKSLGGIEYDAQAALYPPPGAAGTPGSGIENQTELLLIDVSDDPEDEPLTAELLSDKEPAGETIVSNSKKELEARMIAHRIKELMADFKITDKESGALRPLSYRDIVILLRTTKDWDAVFKKVLNEEGIPALTAARTGYFATAEIQTILQIISVLDNPHQDIPLFGAMKSFFGDFTDEEIAVIKTKGREREGLHDKLRRYTVENAGDKELLAKIDRFSQFIDSNRRKAIYTPIADLLRELVIESGYYHHIAVRPDGEQRTANLEMLLKKAASFAETSYHGLFHFVRYIEQLEKYDVDYGEAGILDEQADVVRLMSIHKSKGLEFPVCFVAGLHKQVNRMDSRGVLCLDVDLGLGVDYIDPQLRVRRTSLRKNIISQKIKLDSFGEELRILYVAMTRAKEKLILTGVTKKIPLEDTDKARPSFLKLTSANHFLDLLMPLIRSDAAKDVFLSRVYTLNDLVSGTVHEMIDLNHRRDILLANLEIDRSGGRSGAAAALSEKVTQVSEKFARPYPHENLAGLYAKTTVSELKRASLIADIVTHEEDNGDVFNQILFAEPEIVPYIPKFMKEEQEERAVSSGSERGSAYHKVMEVIGFKELHMLGETEPQISPQIEAEIKGQIENAFLSGRLSAEYKDAVPLHKIIAFFETRSASPTFGSLSPLAARMITADKNGKLFKEQPFVLGLDATRLSADLPAGETILVQGIIDVFFEEADGLVILDYKSDAVQTKAELTARYEKQLAYYQEALEQLTGKPVKEKLIYSFALNEVVALT